MLPWFLFPIGALLGIALVAFALLGIGLILAFPRLPSIEILTDYHPKIPLRIYTADGHLIGEYGEERRQFVRIQDVPELMKQAIANLLGSLKDVGAILSGRVIDRAVFKNS